MEIQLIPDGKLHLQKNLRGLQGPFWIFTSGSHIWQVLWAVGSTIGWWAPGAITSPHSNLTLPQFLSLTPHSTSAGLIFYTIDEQKLPGCSQDASEVS